MKKVKRKRAHFEKLYLTYRKYCDIIIVYQNKGDKKWYTKTAKLVVLKLHTLAVALVVGQES